jgi:hypothetical protein
MNIIIAGSRSYKDYEEMRMHMARFFNLNIGMVICGETNGADVMGRKWAAEFGIPCKSMPANWTVHNEAAGPIRNQKMVDIADGAIFFWDGRSPGTKDCITRAVKKRIMVIIIPVKGSRKEIDVEEAEKPSFDITTLLSQE